MDLNLLLKQVIDCSIAAGKEIMTIYEGDDFGISHKEDNSPITKADIVANEIIVNSLSKTKFPILSEEGSHAPFEERKKWSKLWIVDPIDGTKEFINRNGEFTVNIALIEDQTPILGVIYVPAKQTLYFGSKEHGSSKLNDVKTSDTAEEIISKSIQLPLTKSPEQFTVVASRSHQAKETSLFIDALSKKHGQINTLNVGSSLKLCMVAEGSAHIYPRFIPTMEWDIAAGHAICLFADANVIDYKTNEQMKYNRENLKNNWFMASRQTVQP